MHTLDVKPGHAAQKLRFVVLANLFHTPHAMHRTYDVKGSWVGAAGRDFLQDEDSKSLNARLK